MRHEIETADYPPVVEERKRRKRRYRGPDEYPRDGSRDGRRQKPKFPPANFSVVELLGRRIPEMPNIESLKEEFKPFEPLITLFVFKNGPKAIVRRVIDQLGPSTASADFASHPNTERVRRLAAGMTFERLAYLFLNDKLKKESGEKETVLDPGSASRIFQSLRKFNGSIDFAPDGIVMTNFPSEARLSGLCEYKLSPDKDIADLKRQVQIMTAFLTRFSGQKLKLNTDLDKNLRRKGKEIKVDNNVDNKPTINIVIHGNSPPLTDDILQNPLVNVHLTPFPRELVIRLASAILQDFGKPQTAS